MIKRETSDGGYFVFLSPGEYNAPPSYVKLATMRRYARTASRAGISARAALKLRPGQATKAYYRMTKADVAATLEVDLRGAY